MRFRFRYILSLLGLFLCLLAACRNPGGDSAQAYGLKLDAPLLSEASQYSSHLVEKPYNRNLHLDLKGLIALALENPSLCQDNVRFYPLNTFNDLNDFLGKAQAAGFSYTLIEAKERGFQDITVFKLERNLDVMLVTWTLRWGKGNLMVCIP